MNKPTPVTPISGYLSLQCSGTRTHAACRATEFNCGCPCHEVSEAVVGASTVCGEAAVGASTSTAGPLASTRPPENTAEVGQPSGVPTRPSNPVHGDDAGLTPAPPQ